VDDSVRTKPAIPGMVFGTYEQAMAMVGATTEPVVADLDVNQALSQGFCGMIQDGNPAYWGDGVASYGGPIAPPAMLLTWLLPLPWRPDMGDPKPVLAASLPLPGNTVINVRHHVEMFRPLHYGVRLVMVEKLISVSPLKRTKLGDGHFITTEMLISAQTGEEVGVITNTVLRYAPTEGE
jgi:hypothetical protein